MRVGFYGGSFNPPHYSHFLAATWALCSGSVDQVWMVPCFRHAFGKDLVAYEHRIAMCHLGIQAFGPQIQVSDCESHVQSPYTIDTLLFLQEQFPHTQFRLMIGSDIAHETPAWKSFSRLATMAPPLWIPRGGYPIDNPLGFSLPEISSSLLRDRLAQGLSIEGCLPPSISAYIQNHNLYPAKDSAS